MYSTCKMKNNWILRILLVIYMCPGDIISQNILTNELDSTSPSNDNKISDTNMDTNVSMTTGMEETSVSVTTMAQEDIYANDTTLLNTNDTNENVTQSMLTKMEPNLSSEISSKKSTLSTLYHKTTTPTLTALDITGNILGTRCDDHDMLTSCDVTQFERCVLIRERAPRCVCLSGFSRDKTGRCIASKHYRASLLTLLTYTPDLQNDNSAEYRRLVYEAKEGILAAADKSRLSAVYIDIDIITMSRQVPSNKLAIEFALLLPRHYAPDEITVERDIIEGIKQVLTSGEWLGMKVAFLAETSIPLLEDDMAQLKVKAPDPCSDPLLNYCHPAASCHVTTSWGFTCACSHGYLDQSPYIQEAPGEICKLNCDCNNGGECLMTASSDIICSCPSWYIGDKCDIDGKVLFIVLCVVISSLIVIALVICCVCLRNMRKHQEEREKSTLDAAITRDFPTALTYKAPSTWLDHWQYNNTDPPSPEEECKPLPYAESLGHSSVATFPRGLSIPRPHIRSPLGHNTIDTIRHPKTREKWVWPET